MKKGDQIAGLKAVEGGNQAFAGICAFMLVIGAFVAVASAILETSAVRQGAIGAMWTGWNVLWGAFLLMTRRTEYAVYRAVREPDEE